MAAIATGVQTDLDFGEIAVGVKKILPFILFCLTINFSFNHLFAQVAINITNTMPDNSAMLDIVSTSKGLLIPRMSSVQRNNITSPATGLLVFDNTSNTFWYHNGSGWQEIIITNNIWNLSGNTSTNPATNFIGTADNQNLRFKRNNFYAGEIDTVNTSFGLSSGNVSLSAGKWNSSFGVNALHAITTGSNNTAIGYQALFSNRTGRSNTANGFQSLYTTTSGVDNTATGTQSLFANTTGYQNTAMGVRALFTNTTGFFNTASGDHSLFANTTGNDNTGTGYGSLYNNSTGAYNTANGSASLASNTTGYYNTSNGSYALTSNISGGSNTANGSLALYSNITGSYNTANGFAALSANTSGYDNTADGSNALNSNTTGFNNTANGFNSLLLNMGGFFNTANGSDALSSNTTGYVNTASGAHALVSNTIGNNNTAIGSFALNANTTGGYNTSVGFEDLFLNETGSGNTGVGYEAGVTSNNLSNTTAIGTYAKVDASNKVVIGDPSVASIGGQVGWTNYSDERIKNEVKENVPGLVFINALRPVTYHFSLQKEYLLLGRKSNVAALQGGFDIEKINFTGLIAQEADAAAKKIGYDFSGVDKSGKIWGLRYGEFIAPLIKAVQELSNQHDEMKKQLLQIEDLKKEIELLKSKE